jgi:hypothetical protein
MLLWGHAVAWLIEDSSRPCPSRLGEKRLGTFGSLPVRGGSSPVDCCLPLVLAHVADPCRCCPLEDAGDTLVRLGRPAERLRASGQHECGGSVRLGRMALGRFQPRAGGGGPVSFSELLKPRADGVKPSVDLPPTAWRWPGLAVHASQRA